MKVVSVNRGETRVVNWRGKEVRTGIFKFPVDAPIFLGATDVVGDSVVDRRFHGGIDKAVYAYSLSHYAFWKEMYSELDWSYGMFGENLTIEGLDESKMLIGSRYKIGEAEVEVCQPRQPCFKLGVRFGTQSILKPFVKNPYPGVYFRVIQSGLVSVGDELVQIAEQLESPSIAAVYSFMYRKQSGAEQAVLKAINCKFLPDGIRDTIKQTQFGK